MTDASQHMSGRAAPGGVVVEALGRRLAQAAQALGIAVDGPTSGENSPEEVGTLLAQLVAAVRPTGDAASLWLLFSAVAAAYPREEELLDLKRFCQHNSDLETSVYLLEACHASALNGGVPDHDMVIVDDGVIVDVDFCATNEHHTGIQRVVRETMPRWLRDHDPVLVAWTSAHGAMRSLDRAEEDRVLRWYERQGERGQPDVDRAHIPADPTDTKRCQATLVVPWRSVVILAENPEPQRCPSLAALAQYSGNTVTAIGYDCIPVVSPELIHPGLPDRFMRYLTVVKHSRVIAGISASATEEFSGFSQMMPVQGLPSPRVVEVALPVEVPVAEVAQHLHSASDVPVVLSVGSFEPRKNQLALLFAAERLWREGLHFELRFIGGGGWRTEFEALLNRLQRAGRPVSVAVGISDSELWSAYRQARFTAFVSLHEGYGLPVAESLAHGVPALTASFGSTAEIAREGGAVTVDPRDDDALVRELRRMLTDDQLIDELRRQAAARPPRTWDDYARELWTVLVGDVAS